MKIYLIPLALSLFFLGCKSEASKNGHSTKDSSIIQLPKPQKINDADVAKYTSQLNAIFDSNLLNRGFNGGILVAKEGTVLYEKYVGFTNPKTKEKIITDSTTFHLASASKPFTGVTILKLIQAGKIALDDDIKLFFPNFPYAAVTIKDLLSHRSGLPNYLYFMDDKTKWPTGKMVSNQDVLNFMVQYQPALSYKPGTHFSYCNTNFILLALIIEKVTGKPYPKYLNETIFKPLGMEHTFVYTPSDSGKVIDSYKPSGALWEHDVFDNTYGDKNIYSTPRDMMKWDAGLYSENFIRQSLLDSAYQPQSLEKPSIHNYGLGWRMLNLPNGKKVIYHNGRWHGFSPAFARLIDEKAVIIILGNQFNNNMYYAAKLAYNVFGDYMQSEPEKEEEGTPSAQAKIDTRHSTAKKENTIKPKSVSQKLFKPVQKKEAKKPKPISRKK